MKKTKVNLDFGAPDGGALNICLPRARRAHARPPANVPARPLTRRTHIPEDHDSQLVHFAPF